MAISRTAQTVNNFHFFCSKLTLFHADSSFFFFFFAAAANIDISLVHIPYETYITVHYIAAPDAVLGQQVLLQKTTILIPLVMTAPGEDCHTIPAYSILGPPFSRCIETDIVIEMFWYYGQVDEPSQK